MQLSAELKGPWCCPEALWEKGSPEPQALTQQGSIQSQVESTGRIQKAETWLPESQFVACLQL